MRAWTLGGGGAPVKFARVAYEAAETWESLRQQKPGPGAPDASPAPQAVDLTTIIDDSDEDQKPVLDMNGKKDKKKKKEKKDKKEKKKAKDKKTQENLVEIGKKRRAERQARARVRARMSARTAEAAEVRARQLAVVKAERAARRAAQRKEAYSRIKVGSWRPPENVKEKKPPKEKKEAKKEVEAEPEPYEKKEAAAVVDIMSLWADLHARLAVAPAVSAEKTVEEQLAAREEARKAEMKREKELWDKEQERKRQEEEEAARAPAPNSDDSDEDAENAVAAIESSSEEEANREAREQNELEHGNGSTLPPAMAALKRSTPDMGEAMKLAMAQKEKAGEQAEKGKNGPFESYHDFDAWAVCERAHGREPVYESDDENEGSEEEDASEEEPDNFLPAEFFSLQNLPPEPPTEKDFDTEPEILVAHFVSFAVGAWQEALRNPNSFEGAGLTTQSAAMFRSEATLRETTDALKPLLQQLRKREVKDAMIAELANVTKLAAGGDYKASNAAYVNLTIGRKTWMQSMATIQMQQNHGGSLCKIIQPSDLVDFDTDPVVERYMLALKRIIQFVQCIRPPADLSKAA